MHSITPLNNNQFKIFKTIKQAWSLIKGSKWPILAPYLIPFGCLNLGISLRQALIRFIKIVKPKWPTVLGLLIIFDLMGLILCLLIDIPFVGWAIYIAANIWLIPLFTLSLAIAYHQLLSSKYRT